MRGRTEFPTEAREQNLPCPVEEQLVSTVAQLDMQFWRIWILKGYKSCMISPVLLASQCFMPPLHDRNIDT